MWILSRTRVPHPSRTNGPSSHLRFAAEQPNERSLIKPAPGPMRREGAVSATSSQFKWPSGMRQPEHEPKRFGERFMQGLITVIRRRNK
jgi:hypothetical protein